jgi:hypothetical protein
MTEKIDEISLCCDIINARFKLEHMHRIIDLHELFNGSILLYNLYHIIYSEHKCYGITIPTIGLCTLLFTLLIRSRRSINDNIKKCCTYEFTLIKNIKENPQSDVTKIIKPDTNPLIKTKSFLFGPYTWWMAPKL